MKALEFATVGTRNCKDPAILPVEDDEAVEELVSFLDMAFEEGAVIVPSYKQPNTYAIHWHASRPSDRGHVLRVRVVNVGW